MTAQRPATTQRAAATQHTQPSAAARSVPVVSVVLFLLGCAGMVWAAASIMSLGVWSQRWGQIPVMLGFFLFMAIVGRWFWSGVDAIIAAVRDRGQDG